MCEPTGGGRRQVYEDGRPGAGFGVLDVRCLCEGMQ